jgi:hypothetical protein
MWKSRIRLLKLWTMLFASSDVAATQASRLYHRGVVLKLLRGAALSEHKASIHCISCVVRYLSRVLMPY